MAPDYYDYSARKSSKIGAQRAALIYREPLKKGYSSGSLVINEVVLGTRVNKPPVHAPDPYGWHHGCCRPDGEVDGERFIGTHGIISRAGRRRRKPKTRKWRILAWSVRIA